MRISLRTKLIVASLLILTPVLLVLILSYRSSYDIQKDQVLADQARVAQVVSVTVDDAFNQSVAMARSYATDPVVLSLDHGRMNSYLARLVPIYPEYDDPIGVFDAQGNLVGSAANVAFINVADRPWFQNVMRTGQPTISDIIISRGTGRPIVVAAAPIVDREGRRIGAVTSVLGLDHLPDTLTPVQRARDQHIFLTDRTGRLAFYTAKPELSWEERDVSGYAPVRSALAGEPFMGEQTDSLLGDRRMVVTTLTPRYGWIVGVSMPVDVALAPVQQALRNSLLVFAAVVLLTIGLALAVAEFLLRPLRQLTGFAVALGRGELHRRVKITTGDELERLGESFNSMSDEVQRALEIREEFLSVASHELKTPLTIIKGYVQWMLRQETDEARRRALQVMSKQANRMSELLDEMLTVSELRAGRIELHWERFDLTDLAREVVDRTQMISEKHRFRFHGTEGAIVDADLNQIEMVLTNLVDNAIRYSPQGGDVEITVSKTDTEAVVSVTDHGQGIPQEKQKHVFEPFFQVQPAIAGYGGLGLGLFISKQIVERHRGRIWFESKEGAGSTFHFSLPLAGAA